MMYILNTGELVEVAPAMARFLESRGRHNQEQQDWKDLEDRYNNTEMIEPPTDD